MIEHRLLTFPRMLCIIKVKMNLTKLGLNALVARIRIRQH
jgi:hypothetical protein